ncbi:MAG: WYL domain-containing protein [Lachnospiraceae bacterium]|nr:WYL domain-containing protein [Lachnospiraceae bacterium]
MLFSELYSTYYNAVARILRSAAERPVDKKELQRLILENAFGESLLTIEPALSEGRWQLLLPGGSSVLEKAPEMPLTTLQKQWVNAISLDKRMRLFTDEPVLYPDVPPLFTEDMITVTDRYSDGDDYEDEAYRKRFRLILSAIRKEQLLRITTENRRGRLVKRVILPLSLEYSEKDDKFRLIASGKPDGGTYNLSRLKSCSLYNGEYWKEDMKTHTVKMRKVTFELYDERNALERSLLHFAHFEKEVERLDEKKYLVTISYDRDDETEMVIRLLSFGPMVRVTGPDRFTELIRERLRNQKELFG